MNDKLNDENFVIFAAKYYDNPQCFSTEEFYEDLNRFKYLKRLLGKYRDTGELKERLILNHIIIIYNVFGQAATKMLFMKLKEYRSSLKPFIVLLGFLPDKITGIDENIFYTADVPLDQVIVSALRKI